MPSVFAHETWFIAGETLSLALLTAALVVTLLVRLIALRFPGVDVPFLAGLVWPFARPRVRAPEPVSLTG